MKKDWFNNNIKVVLNNKTTNRNSAGFPDLTGVSLASPLLCVPNVNDKFICKGGTFHNLVTAVQYEEGKVIYFPKQYNTIGISFLFTGCYMAQFTYNNTEYIAHISTGQGYDRKPDWNEFVNKCVDDDLFRDFYLYKPFDNFAVEYIRSNYRNGRTTDVCGIIDGSGYFYTGLIRYSDFELVQLYTSYRLKRVNGTININNAKLLQL